MRRRLGDDTSFSELRISLSTAPPNRRMRILVTGRVPDQSSLDQVKSVMEQEISPKFSVIYAVEVQDGAEVPSGAEIY